MPKFYMLIGVPASGKSTWRSQHAGNAVIVSTDDIIEQTATASGRTYNEVFKENIKFATQLAEQRMIEAFDANLDVIHDQTNLTPKSRNPKLALVPDNYEKIAVVFLTPEDAEWQRRLDSRPGKTIPQNILMGMRDSMVFPDPEEGFNRIEVVGGEE
jgi:predicted kinase